MIILLYLIAVHAMLPLNANDFCIKYIPVIIFRYLLIFLCIFTERLLEQLY